MLCVCVKRADVMSRQGLGAQKQATRVHYSAEYTGVWAMHPAIMLQYAALSWRRTTYLVQFALSVSGGQRRTCGWGCRVEECAAIIPVNEGALPRHKALETLLRGVLLPVDDGLAGVALELKHVYKRGILWCASDYTCRQYSDQLQYLHSFGILSAISSTSAVEFQGSDGFFLRPCGVIVRHLVYIVQCRNHARVSNNNVTISCW